MNLDETQAFRRQPDDISTLTEVTIIPSVPELLPPLTRSTFPEAGPAPLRRGDAVRQQIAAAEAIAKHGRNSRVPAYPAPIPVSPIPASPFLDPGASKVQVRSPHSPRGPQDLLPLPEIYVSPASQSHPSPVRLVRAPRHQKHRSDTSGMKSCTNLLEPEVL